MSAPAAKQEPRILGLAIGVAALVMIGGVLGGALALVKLDFSGAGMCLLAAGVAAGFVANAVLRT